MRRTCRPASAPKRLLPQTHSSPTGPLQTKLASANRRPVERAEQLRHMTQLKNEPTATVNNGRRGPCQLSVEEFDEDGVLKAQRRKRKRPPTWRPFQHRALRAPMRGIKPIQAHAELRFLSI